MSSNPPGYTGTFRYSDQYPDAVTPWWDPHDDLDDVAAELRELIHKEQTPAATVFEAFQNTGCPDVEVHAAVFMLPSPPWPTKKNQYWTWILYWKDDSGVNVVEHPDKDAAVDAFFKHIAFCEIDGNRYDYVTDPRNPRTAMPPGWKPQQAFPAAADLGALRGDHGEVGPPPL